MRYRRWMISRAHLFAPLALALACGGGSPAADAATRDAPGSDASADATVEECTEDLVPVAGDEGGHPDPLGSAAGEARAGRLGAADVPADESGLGLWREGDYVLANDRVGVIIEGPGRSDLFDPWGGKPVGIGRVEAGALVDMANFNEIAIGVGRFTSEPTSVTVMADGSDGGPAVVRAIGTLRPIPFIDSFAEAITRTDYGGLEVAVDYTLAPDAEHVDVRYHYFSERSGPLRVDPFHLLFQKFRMPPVAPEVGFDVTMGEVMPWGRLRGRRPPRATPGRAPTTTWCSSWS